MKYYWISYTFANGSGQYQYIYFNEAAMKNEHPFERMDKPSMRESRLLNWKEITEEEYNLFLKRYA